MSLSTAIFNSRTGIVRVKIQLEFSRFGFQDKFQLFGAKIFQEQQRRFFVFDHGHMWRNHTVRRDMRLRCAAAAALQKMATEPDEKIRLLST